MPDTNDCESLPCGSHTCVDELDGYVCLCGEGFTGTHCEIDIDDCVYHSCAEGSVCRDGVASYSCDCAETQKGDYCEIEIGIYGPHVNVENVGKSESYFE